MRTFSRADLDAARAAWDAGSFSDEWIPFREQAARVGMLWPPSGGPLDSWDVAHPSQRAILVQAIRDAPAMLAECIDASSSWGEVIARLTKRGAAEASGRTRHGVAATRRAVEATRRNNAALEAIGPSTGSLRDHGVSWPPGGSS